MPETGGKQAYPVGKARGGEGMRRALEVYKENFPHIDAILVGTRRGDPHGGAHSVYFFCPSLIASVRSNTFLPKHDGLGLAALRTRASDHQLVVLRHMGLPSYVESAVLLLVRSGVRISLLSER